ncbi:salicylate carboxymethyltransferase-like [Cucurbita maxima]|uniref:Salicylate carboxymethyltransferase-like n=1 Tax=Cucurbita maxima TaxID=3661 RepID=A0A6J1ILA1_CUCMA|nr:salicylate carboxymethyltransferase-like [Cucurbita maxima]
MEAIKILHTNSGVGHDSYAKNSLLQQKAISTAWPIIKEALQDFCTHNIPTTFAIADLGCASGPNTLMIVSNLIKQLHHFYQNLPKQSLHYQVFFNDLPANDFNLIFRSLPDFLENLKTQIGDDFGPCFFNGVPGSFYGRLFPNKSLHFVHSSSSLHWLSQAPEGMEMENKGNIFIDSTSPENVIEGFRRQFQKDFSVFLKCRAEEVVAGGGMVVTMLGRTAKEHCYAFELFNLAMKKMVAEGMVEEEKVDRFNMPIFMPTPEEVKAEIHKEGSFMIKRLEVLRTRWNLYNNNSNEIDSSTGGVGIGSSYNVANCIRSVIEPIMTPHFGEPIVEQLFDRYKQIIRAEMFNKRSEFIFLTISLTTI